MLGIHNLPEPYKSIIVSVIVLILCTSISILFYKYGKKKWHFVIGKFFIEMSFSGCFVIFPLTIIGQYLSEMNELIWFYVGYFALLMVLSKKTIAFESRIIDRLCRLNDKPIELKRNKNDF